MSTVISQPEYADLLARTLPSVIHSEKENERLVENARRSVSGLFRAHRDLLVQLLDNVFAWFATFAVGVAEAAGTYSVLDVKN